jgi:tRNA pseudouridine38-40 synthase
MPRYKITIEYDGSPFVGWQRQDTGPSVQTALEDAVFAFSGERVQVQGAGRTDTGVHAAGQVAHLDLVEPRRPDTIREAVNFHLKPQPVAIVAAELAAEGFHARFSATGRRYLYRILNRRAPPALERGHVWHVPVPLAAERMAEAARVLEGHHDFNSFRSTSCQAASSFKTLDRLAVTRLGEEIRIEAASRSFLHNQVRILVGTLKLAGEGKWSVDDVRAALAARDRTRAGPTAPPEGLCLTEVRYDSPAGSGHQRRDTEYAVDEE